MPTDATRDRAVEAMQCSKLHSHTFVSPRSVTALILRVRTLVIEWIQIEVDEDSITGAEGLINEEVVKTFLLAGGDLSEAIPFALLEARKGFVKDAGDREYTLNEQRALTCEVLARQTVSLMESMSYRSREESGTATASSHISLSKRFIQLEDDGDRSLPTSALESASDQNCIIFLSSPEAQRCAEDLWKGKLTQSFGPSGLVFFEPHQATRTSFLGRLDPARLSVPKYSYYSGLAIHIALIVIYTFSTLEKTDLDNWEIVLWVFAAGYLLEDITRWFKMRGLDKIISFWVLVDLCTDVLFVTAFVLRATGWMEKDEERADSYQLLAFQFLSCIAPLLWMQLLKLADGFQYFGVIQIVLLRMLQETAAFFLLLLLTAIGFAQSFFALDAADGRRVANSGSVVANMLMAAILGQPDFDAPSGNFGEPFGIILFYIYAFITVMLLANILVAFFSSAYDKTVDNATDVFRAYFCSKVVSSIRAPDQFVYLPPFNIIEAFLIAPFEPIVPAKAYAKINRYVQSVLFCIPLLAIATYESQVEGKMATRIRMEMLDDLPEERTRRLKQVCGIQDSIQDPTFGSEEEQDPQSTVSIRREDFVRAAKEYAQSSSESSQSGAHVYAKGWTWKEGDNPPYTGCLARTFSLPTNASQAKDGDDSALLDSMAVSEQGNGEEAGTAGATTTNMIRVTQSICYSSTWHVPILYLEAVDGDGSTLSVESLCQSPLFLTSAHSQQNQVADGLAVFPTVSMGENPSNGHNSAYLHPCETAKWIAKLLAEPGKSDSSLAYLESFIMLCSTVVEMRPGGRAGLGDGAKVLTYKQNKEGQDMQITTVKFAELLKKLPSVKSEEEEEKENRAVTTKDLEAVLQELKTMREQIEKLTSTSSA